LGELGPLIISDEVKAFLHQGHRVKVKVT